MNRLTGILLSTAFLCSAAMAQTQPHPYAMKMAVEVVDSIFPMMKSYVDTNLGKLEESSKSPNAPLSLKIFTQELRNSFNREVFIGMLANEATNYFTEDDFIELQKIRESRVAKKAEKFGTDMDGSKLGESMLAVACDRTYQRLVAVSEPLDDGFRKMCKK